MRYKYFNPNPIKDTASDCVVRMLCKVTGRPWAENYYYGNTPTGVLYNSDSEFMRVAGHADINKLYEVVDELMECLALVNPKLYNGVITKLGG